MTTEAVLEDVLGRIGSVVQFAIAPWRIGTLKGRGKPAWRPDPKRLADDLKSYSIERLIQTQELNPPSDNAGRMLAIKVRSASGKPILFVPVGSSPEAIDSIVKQRIGTGRFGRDHKWAYERDYHRLRPLVGPSFDSVLVVVSMSDACKILQTKPQVTEVILDEIEEAKRKSEMIVLLKDCFHNPTDSVLEAIRDYKHAVCFHGADSEVPRLLRNACIKLGFAPRSYRICGIACQDNVDTIAHYLVHNPEIHVELLMDRLFPPYEGGPVQFTNHPRILRRGKRQIR